MASAYRVGSLVTSVALAAGFNPAATMPSRLPSGASSGFSNGPNPVPEWEQRLRRSRTRDEGKPSGFSLITSSAYRVGSLVTSVALAAGLLLTFALLGQVLGEFLEARVDRDHLGASDLLVARFGPRALLGGDSVELVGHAGCAAGGGGGEAGGCGSRSRRLNASVQ